MKPKNIYQSISLIAAGVAAFLAVPSIWPYGFYQLVRWIVSLSAVYNAYQQGSKEKYFWASIFTLIAILFNPIAPIHFEKEVWQVIDFIVGAMMIFAYFKLKKNIL